MNKNTKISLIIFVILVGGSFYLSNKEKAEQKEKRREEVYEMFQPKKRKEVDFVAGSYSSDIYSQTNQKYQLLKLNLSPIKPSDESARASLTLYDVDKKPLYLKMGSWSFVEKSHIRVTFIMTEEGRFEEPEIMAFKVRDDSLVAVEYDRDIYNTKELRFIKEIFSIEPVDAIDVTLCGKEMKADSVAFGGVNFTKVFERIVRDNPKASFCGGDGSISLNFSDEVLGVKVKEWRRPKSGGYISEKQGPVNSYVISLYSKSDALQSTSPFNQSIFIYKFDFDKNEVSMLMAFDGSFRVIDSIEESDIDSNLRNLSVAEELKIHFKSIDETADMVSKESSLWWIDEEGYSILVPSTESFFIAKSSEIYSDSRLIPNQHFYEELAVAKQVFARRGFVLNEKNSSDDITDKSFYDYIQAYKKGDELCNVLVNPDNTSLNISCGNTFKKAYTEQIPFIKAVEDFRPEYKNMAVRVRNQSGDFFQVGVSGGRSGSSAVIKKEGDSYRVLLIRQEAPECDLIEKEQIPNEVLSSIGGGSCFTEEGEYRWFEE